MKLDSRIIEGKKPLDCFDAENRELIKPFLNKEGYVSNNLENFCLLDGCFKRLLSNVSKDVKDCFKTSINDGDGGNWKYFLPVEWVKEPEKKYRPFTGIEFAEKFGLWIGHIIRIRDRPENAGQEYEYKIMFVGYRWYKGMFEVFINGCWIDLLTLFELYEYMEDGEWHKFGIEE